MLVNFIAPRGGKERGGRKWAGVSLVDEGGVSRNGEVWNYVITVAGVSEEQNTHICLLVES